MSPFAYTYSVNITPLKSGDSSSMPKYRPPQEPYAQPAAPVTAAPEPHGPTFPTMETLEQRIYDLLYPHREVDYGGYVDTQIATSKDERKLLILCDNIAFLIRHSRNSNGHRVQPDDLSLTTKNWEARASGTGVAGVGIFVHVNGYSNFVVRTTVNLDEKVVDKLAEHTDVLLQPFFPGL